MLVVLSITLCAACGDDNSTNNTNPQDDAGSSDAAEADTDETQQDAGADAAENASSLGAVCNNQQPCEGGAECVVLFEGSTEGFCSSTCSTPGEVGSCADNYDGSGAPVCGGQYCVIACGADNNLSESCPDGLVCIDATSSNGSPNGMTDLCARLDGNYSTLFIDGSAVVVDQTVAKKTADGNLAITAIYNDGGSDGAVSLRVPADAAPGEFNCTDDAASFSYQWPAAIGTSYTADNGCGINISQVGAVGDHIVGWATAGLVSEADDSTSQVSFTFAITRSADE